MKKTLTLLLLLAGLTLEARAETLTWHGSEGHMTWNFEDDNWLKIDGSPSRYQDSCDLEFRDIGSGAVALDCFPSPASVLVNSDKDYTFTGYGFLGGALLTKSGKGTLTINSVGNQIDILVKEGTLVLGSDLALGPEPNVTLEGGTLDLGGNTFDSGVSPFILKGNTNSIGNGTFNGVLTVPYDSTLTLCGDLGGGSTIILSGDSTLNLDGHTLTKRLDAGGHTTISHGKIVLDWNLLGAVLEDVTLDLNGNTTYYCDPDSLKGSCSIGNGTIIGFDHNLRVEGDSTLTLFGITRIKDVTITAGQTQVKSLVNDTPGLLRELTVSEGLIAGTDRQSSLADGLYIKSEAELLIESMTLTANNEIHVGEHTITLNQVTIDLSKAEYKLVDSDYYFQLQGLINCKLEMDDVVFDASALELPTGFNPGVNGIGMDFGTDVTIDKETAKNLTLLMGSDWSQTMNLVDGKPVFTALVPTPEPATGTLSLLALAALAARRRRK